VSIRPRPSSGSGRISGVRGAQFGQARWQSGERRLCHDLPTLRPRLVRYRDALVAQIVPINIGLAQPIPHIAMHLAADAVLVRKPSFYLLPFIART
jgi:hypothetical protein